jgi:S-adenosylmethionine-dependent methyltransferase
VSPPANPFDDAGTAQDFAVGHYSNLRGRVRTANVDGQLAEHLAPDPLRIVDVGGGSGEQSVPLARRGHAVTVADPSEAMLEEARVRLTQEPDTVAARVDLVRAGVDDVVDRLGAGSFDAVLCHGVFMYLDDPQPGLRALVDLATPGGLVSVLATNRRALALRPGLLGDWPCARQLFDSDRYLNGVGVDARADDPDDLGDRLDRLGADTLAWYGVRLFTDAWPIGRPPEDDPDAVLAAEWEAARRDPYRQVSRLFHLIARRR